jgi:hypothetical protein
MENRPRALFERMFGAAGTTDPKARMLIRQEDRSILDAINEDVKRLQGKLGGPDRGKIDQYLEAIRDVERRIQLAEKQQANGGGDLPSLAGPGGVPGVFSDYFKLLTDLMVLAWQTDMTRVITFQMGHEMSGRAYPEIGFGDSHHSVTHHHGDPEKIAKTTKINIFHTKMLAYYLDKLRSTPDGDGSLLDHSLILWGSGMSDSNTHSALDVPLLLAGKASGRIKGDRHLVAPKGTQLANAMLDLAQTFGAEIDRFGVSTGRMAL